MTTYAQYAGCYIWFEKILAKGSHNLFCYVDRTGNMVPITYRDVMVYMRAWLKKLGENDKSFSSHSLRRGATTMAKKKNLTDREIQLMGHWRSDCYKIYIDNEVQERVVTAFKFNK